MVRLATFLATSSFATVALGTSNVCQQEPFLALEFLSAYPPAESFCSSKFPLARCTSTVLKTVVSTATTTVNTLTITTGTSTVTSVGGTVTSTTYTGTETDTATTGTLTSTYVTTSTATITATSTLTVYNNKRDASPVAALPALIKRPPHSKRQAKLDYFNKRRGNAKKTTAAPNARATQFSSFVKQASSFISTACSCIETPLPCITVTKTVTTSSTSSVISTSDVQAFSTKVITNTATVSQISTTTIFVVVITTASNTIQATTTTTAQATETDLADCTPGCGTYGGAAFTITCGASETFTGATNSYVDSSANTFTACADACGEDGECNTFSYSGETSTCTLYDNASNYGGGNTDTDSGYGVFVASC